MVYTELWITIACLSLRLPPLIITFESEPELSISFVRPLSIYNEGGGEVRGREIG